MFGRNGRRIRNVISRTADLGLLTRMANMSYQENEAISIDDSGADTTCLGYGWIVTDTTERVCNVSGFGANMELKERPIVSAVTAYDHPYDGNTYILQVNEGIWLG